MLEKLLSVITLIFFLLLNPAVANQASQRSPEILVLGDSISAAYGIDTDQGWVSLLQQKLTQSGYNYNVTNASVSGDTTRTGLNRLDDALKQHQPTITIVALGGNDGLRGLPFSEIENSLSSIIEKNQQQNVSVLLAGVRLPPNYGAFYNARFADLFKSLASKYNIPLVPKILDQVADVPELMQADGIHPTAKGQQQMLNNIWPQLQPMLKSKTASTGLGIDVLNGVSSKNIKISAPELMLPVTWFCNI